MVAANAKFVQEGCSIGYTPAAAVNAGAIVNLGDIIGIAKNPIAASVLGALAIEGVYSIVKSGSTGPIFAVGDAVFWDSVNSVAVRVGFSSAGLWYLGTCLEAAGASDTSVLVELRPHGLPACMQGRVWEDVTLAGGSKTLDAEDCGKVINITAGHATNVITLPAIAAGLSRFVVRAGVAAGRIALSPNASDRIQAADLPATDDVDRILTAATAQVGDFCELDYGGANGYVVISQKGIWTGS